MKSRVERRSGAMLCAGMLVSMTAVASTAASGEDGPTAESWMQFGGPRGDFTATVRMQPWGEEGPRVRWERELGAGYSGIVGDERQLVTMYRDGDDEIVVAIDPATGEGLWEHRYDAPGRDGHLAQFGLGPHATPLLLDERVVSLGYTGELRALSRSDGSVSWQKHLLDELGGEVTSWGFSASPILHEGRVIVLMGGAHAALAIDPASGDIAWKSEAGSASYSTPRVITVDGHEQLLFFAKDALRALDPSTGALLWSHAVINGYENHASNLLWDGESLLWVASQQEAAGRLLKLRGDMPPEVVWRNRRARLHHWNAVLQNGVVFASFGDTAQIFTAVDFATGKVLWRDRRFGLARPLQLRGVTVLLNEDGDLFLVRFDRDGADILSRWQFATELSRTVPTALGDSLYIRDGATLRALALDTASTAEAFANP